MTDSSKTPATTTPAAKKKGGASFPLVVLVLLVIAGGAGFGLGFSQNFVPVEGGANSLFGPGLKNQYFLHATGSSQSPYSVAVTINGHQAATLSANNKIVEISNLVVKGRNKVLFEAKRLPAGMYDANHGWLDVTIVQGKRTGDGGYKDGQDLVKYERKVSDTGDFRDEMDWEPVNE